MLTDPIADMLSRIRNANRALHDHVEMPNSRIKEEIARLLKDEGYIRDFRVVGSEAWNSEHEDKKENRHKRVESPDSCLPRQVGGLEWIANRCGLT